MSGQAGSARALLDYNIETTTVVGGFKVKPSDKWHVKIDFARNDSESGMDSFRMPEAEAWAAPKPNQTFDFSLVHLNSDIDTTFWEAGIKGAVELSEGMFLTANYRFLDYEDDAPYLGDDTGSLDFFGLGLAWKF